MECTGSVSPRFQDGDEPTFDGQTPLDDYDVSLGAGGTSFNGMFGWLSDSISYFNGAGTNAPPPPPEDSFASDQPGVLWPPVAAAASAAAAAASAAAAAVSSTLAPIAAVASLSSSPPLSPLIKKERLDNFEAVTTAPFVFEPLPPLPALSATTDSSVLVVVDEQPALDVRTRTPSENRTFSVSVRLKGPFEREGFVAVRVSLQYAAAPVSASASSSTDDDRLTPSQSILGGQKTVSLDAEGRATFGNLCMSEASTRHREREFRLAFALVRSGGGCTLPCAYSTPFYAYTHQKVLSRRRNIKLRTLNQTFGSCAGGEQMHVIGTPFISGPALKCILRTPHGDVASPHMELFSESVLFFTLPAYPLASWSAAMPEGSEIRAQFVVTNDGGKTLSNPLDFTYVATAQRSRY